MHSHVSIHRDISMVKGLVCVTGGTGFLGSWMVKRLLEDGYSVNTTIRPHPEGKRDIRFLTNLPGAAERLQIFEADLDKPDTFAAAIEGCTGVFHVAHPLDFAEKDSEQVKIQRVTNGLQGILRACADAKTVRRVVYTSSISAAVLSSNPGSGLVDENSWTDVELVRSLRMFMGPYVVTKTLAERAAIDVAQELGLDLVTVLPTWITGPFICPNLPETVQISMALIFGDEGHCRLMKDSSLVHVDDVARAHIHLFEHSEAKGRYIVSAAEFKIEDLYHLISAKFPEFKLPTPDVWKNVEPLKYRAFQRRSLKKLNSSMKMGSREMFDEAIRSCKEKGFL